MPIDTQPPLDARLLAGVDMLRRTGAADFQLRYSDDVQPVVWMAIATWQRDGRLVQEVGAALDPLCAVLRLCEEVIDGGHCQHCQRATGFEPDSIEDMPGDDTLCWYQWDPELKTFRRGCASSDPII